MFHAYNHLLYSFPAKREVLYPAKNRGELKKVYDNIVSLSKCSPFYTVDLSKENQEYTIGIKEAALELKAKLYLMQEPEVSGFDSKEVIVSDGSILSAILLNGDTDALPDRLQIKVNSLARGQINKGNPLLDASHNFPSGQYKFYAHVMDETYSLTFIHSKKMNNEETLNSLASYISESIPGINADVENSGAYSSLVIYSDMSGRFGDKKFWFEDDELNQLDIVEFFDMNRVENPPSGANFLLNGLEKQTATNTFTLEDTIQITLNRSGESPVDVRIVPDSNQILKAVDSVISSYNEITLIAKIRLEGNKESYSANKLINEMKSLATMYQEELTACGINTLEDGVLDLDDSLAVTSVWDGGMESLFTRENGFITKLIEKSESIAINPVDYLEKTIVFYPNSGRCFFSNPYITSMYSGMLFSSYC